MADWNSAISGATSGAATGAVIGGGPVGALVGGAIGGLTGLLGGGESDPNAEWEAKIRAANQQYQNSQTAALDPYKQLTDVAASKNALAAYRAELESYNPAKYETSGGGQLTYVDPTDNWQKFLDPNMDLALGNVTGNIQESAAGRGGLYAGDTQREIAKEVANASLGFGKDAMQMAASENQRQIGTQAQNWEQLLSQNQANRAGANQLATNLGTSYSATMQPLEQYTSGLSDLNKSMYSGTTGIANQGLQAGMAQQNQPTTWDQLAGLTTTLAKSGVFK